MSGYFKGSANELTHKYYLILLPCDLSVIKSTYQKWSSVHREIMRPLWLVPFFVFKKKNTLVIFVPIGRSRARRSLKKGKGGGRKSVWGGAVRIGGGGKCVFGEGWEGFRWAKGGWKKKTNSCELLCSCIPAMFPSFWRSGRHWPPLPLYTLHNPLCYRSHTCQPRSASQSRAHGQMAWPRPWTRPKWPRAQRGVGMIMKRITSGY